MTRAGRAARLARVPAPPTVVPRSPLRAALSALVVVALETALLALGLGGFPALARHPQALGLIAVWAASGVALAALRPVRSQDVVERPAGQGALLVALLVIPLFTPLLCAWAAREGLAPLPGGAAPRWAGVALAAGGLWLRVAAMTRLGPRFAPLVALQRTHALETGGLYARLRHPGYVGAALANLGTVIALGSAAGLVSVALFAAALEARMRAEEALLARRFGDAWVAYAARAGRWLPRLG